jgi:hypothetical protein
VLSASGTHFLCNGPKASSDIVTPVRIVACVWNYLMVSPTKHAIEIHRLAHSQRYINMQDNLCTVIEHIVQLKC